MLFDAIFLTLFFLTWTLEGGLVWLAWSIRRRAYGAIWALPFGLLGGAGGGVMVPVVGLDNGVGVGVSMIVAPLGGVLLTGIAYRVWDDYDLGARFAFLGVAATWDNDDIQQAGDHSGASIDSAEPDSPPPPRQPHDPGD